MLMARSAVRLQPIDDEERRCRVELAAAYRICAREGLDDGIWTHFSAQVPGSPDRFLLKPHGILFEEVCASNLIVVDLDGNMIEGEGEWEPTAFYIHSRIHAAYPSAKCILHTHMPYATALSDLPDHRLPMFSQTAVRFRNRISYYNSYDGLALEASVADRLVAAMEGRDILVMAHHGVNVSGHSVADALYTLHYFEATCRELAHVRTLAAGAPLTELPDDIAALTFSQLEDERRDYAHVHLAAYMRVLDRECPDYRN
ncbi:MAG: hypothetical protein FJX55_12140 [Alphaproteobacteria bacterium]|nr:hypothetical protein [Alphaproteobacteria bacterium]